MPVMLISSTVLCVVGLIVGHYMGMKYLPWLARLIWLIGISVLTFAIGLGGYFAANAIAYQSAVSGYHQFLNGTVVRADVQEIKCERDGNCVHTYECDETETTTNEDGEVETETIDHDCPYATYEYRYTAQDSIGGTEDFGHYLAVEPEAWGTFLFIFPQPIPDYLPRGIPPEWQEIRTALDAGRGIPMTTEGTYENYILASNEDLLKTSSDDIDELLELGLLPEHTQDLQDPIYDTWNADKVNFVGFTPRYEPEWQAEVMEFNAALGMELRGDLHLVIIRDSELPSSVSPDAYINALKAYWLNHLDKYALGKNGIMVVIGIDNAHETIEWARADTGMPSGNGVMLNWIEQSLMNEPYDLSVIMGETRAVVENGEVTYTVSQGLIPQAIMVK